jgi:ADP-ribosyl-[dinitrogen reductase] hydrolase
MKMNRSKGAFYGNLIGDALGAPVEFQPRDSYPVVRTMQYCDTYDLPAGSFTDDGSMMLCLAASLVNAGGQDAHNQLAHYVAWYREGYMSVNGECFDIGRTTREALEEYEAEGITEARTTEEFQAGNGSVMRLAPIPIFFAAQTIEEIWLEGMRSSRTTHGAPVAVWGCGLWAALTALAIRGASKWDLLKFLHSVPYSSCNEIAHYPLAWKAVLDREFMDMHRDDVKSGGYVVDSCEAALWAFFRTSTFAEGALLVVNLGRDTDTVGAIYGILAGAFYGYEGIPQEWLDALQCKPMVNAVWDDLCECSSEQ